MLLERVSTGWNPHSDPQLAGVKSNSNFQPAKAKHLDQMREKEIDGWPESMTVTINRRLSGDTV